MIFFRIFSDVFRLNVQNVKYLVALNDITAGDGSSAVISPRPSPANLLTDY